MYRLTWRLLLAGLVAFSHLQFSQIRGRQPYSIVRKIPYLIELPNDRPALIETDKMEAILTEIDADRADGGGWCGFV